MLKQVRPAEIAITKLDVSLASPIDESVDQIVSLIIAVAPAKRRPPGWSEADRFDHWLGLVLHGEKNCGAGG